MKGISVWIWVIAGFLIGIMMFAVSFQLISFIATAQQKELARENLDKIASNVNGLCTHRAGDKFSGTFAFPEKVRSVYVTKDVRFQPQSQRSSGNNLCMNFSKELICDDLDCNLEMQTIVGSENLQSLLNQYLGRYGTNSYDLQILKTECGVAILQSDETRTAFCGEECANETRLVGCQKHSVITLLAGSTLVMTDFTPIFECCNRFPYIVTLLTNTAKYFGGSKIMVIWESNFANPESEKYKPISDALKVNGFEISSFRHKKQITVDDLKDKNQLWIYLPGWCSKQSDVQKTVECTEFIQWDDSEYATIKDFVNSGGKLFIATDYSPYTTQGVVNGILSTIGYNSRVLEANVCSSQGNIVKTTDIKSHPITQNINEFSFTATSEIAC
jgi:hypothetical protein